MSIDVKKVAHLARLGIEETHIPHYTNELTKILAFVAQMDAVETNNIVPMAHPLDQSQPLRADVITETDQRALFQSIAPSVEAGLYLVPQVIE